MPVSVKCTLIKIFLLSFLSLLLPGCTASSSEGGSSGSPSALFTASPVSAACSVSIQFDASASFHENLSFEIIKYEWDYDYDGSVFSAEDTGMLVSHSFNTPGVKGIHTVALSVTDNKSVPETDIITDQIEIDFTNHKPFSDAGGPYTAFKSADSFVTVTLDGSGSYDIDDPCDSVVQYKWDTDGDGFFGSDDSDGTPWSTGTDLAGVSPVIVYSGWFINDDITIALIVSDNYSLWSDAAETEINVRDE